MENEHREMLYSSQSSAGGAYFGKSPVGSQVKKAGDVYIESPSRIIIVSNKNSRREFLVAGFLLDSSGTSREAVILKNNAEDIVEVSIDQIMVAYKINKVMREGANPELIYLDGVPDKIVSGQHWVPKDESVTDAFGYAAKNTYAADEAPSIIWEVQSVVSNDVFLRLIETEDHESGLKNRNRGAQTMKITKRELVTKYRLHSHGFFLSDEFFKFIQNDTYVAPENRDKILMMGGKGKGEYVKLDDMIGPPKKSSQINLDLLK